MPNKQITVASRRRLQNALWGLFIGDALAIRPWFYGVDNIRKDFNGGIQDYQEPPHPDFESFMVGIAYHPDIETAKQRGRAFDIRIIRVMINLRSYSSII